MRSAMIPNETICIEESQPSNDKIFEAGELQGGGIALGLGAVAGIGVMVRGLFVYFLKYEAPKQRPINSLMLHDQITQLITMSISSMMAIIPIATQTSMIEIFGGQEACHIFWFANVIYSLKMVTSGLGMAIYRLICFNNLFKRHFDNKQIAKKIMIAEWILIIGLTSMKVFYRIMIRGWEKAMLHQFCMNNGQEFVETLYRYRSENKNYNTTLLKTVGIFLPIGILQILMIVELFIYLKIIYQLWKQDIINRRDKVISEDTRKQRHKKNVVTLRGQVITFAIEFGYGINILIYNSKKSFVEPSTVVIHKIIGSTVILLIQLLTSHEMKRFISTRYNM